MAKFEVRYQYEVKVGADPKTKDPIYKSKSGKRNVTTEGDEATEKELVSILESSHRRENPHNLKIKSFQRSVDPQPAAQSAGDGALVQLLNAMNDRVTAAEGSIAVLEKTLTDFMATVEDRFAALEQRCKVLEETQPVPVPPEEPKAESKGKGKS